MRMKRILSNLEVSIVLFSLFLLSVLPTTCMFPIIDLQDNKCFAERGASDDDIISIVPGLSQARVNQLDLIPWDSFPDRDEFFVQEVSVALTICLVLDAQASAV